MDHTDLNVTQLPEGSCCVQHDLQDSTTTEEIDAHAGTTLVITDMPCRRCPECGTAFISAQVADVMMRATEQLRSPNLGRIEKSYNELAAALM